MTRPDAHRAPESEDQVAASGRGRGPGRPNLEEAGRLDDHILEAALHSFVTLGFGATTIEKLAAQCHTTRRSITHRFPNKDALLLAVAERWADQSLHAILGFKSSESDPVEICRAICRRLLSMATDPADAALYSVFLGEVGRSGPLSECLIRNNDRLAEGIQRAFLHAQAVGCFQGYSARSLATSAIAIMVSNPLNRAVAGDPQFRDALRTDLYFSEMWAIFQHMA